MKNKDTQQIEAFLPLLYGVLQLFKNIVLWASSFILQGRKPASVNNLTNSMWLSPLAMQFLWSFPLLFCLWFVYIALSFKFIADSACDHAMNDNIFLLITFICTCAQEANILSADTFLTHCNCSNISKKVTLIIH